jgi:precorrin-6Y C5,15-methyltransferase (decarboxylating)
LKLAEPPAAAKQVSLTANLPEVLDVITRLRESGACVAVLASGDPGFFGIVRVLAARVGAAALRVYPAPSSVSLAFSRLGCSWDDAVVVSAHGRAIDDAVGELLGAAKAAVLTSPDNPPQAIGAALVAHGCAPRDVAVITRLGEPDETVFEGDLAALAASTLDPMSVVILRAPHADGGPTLSWGLPEDRFAHRDGMITKAEARAIALGKLQLPRTGVLWDVGAGSGSVAIEAARLAPGLQVFAIDHDPESVARIAANAEAHGVCVDTVVGVAPDVLASLPDPDRVFVGGGGLPALDAALERLRPAGVVVANYALVDRAVGGWQRLGNVVELSVARGVGLGGHGFRLAAENPVFICWGPS